MTLFPKRRKQTDFAAEIQSHIAIEAEQLRKEGFEAAKAVFGVAAEFGRTLDPAADKPQASRNVVLSDSLWKRRYGGSPDILGRAISIDGEPVTVVGIMRRASSSLTQRWSGTSGETKTRLAATSKPIERIGARWSESWET